MRALSLFSGIGGLDLAAEACGIETTAFCEIEDFPVSILKKRWPDIPIYDDVRKIKGSEIIERLGTVDVVHGGFPCQDLSVAWKRAGLVCGGGYTRSGLWYEMLRIISELRPRFVVGENVRGAISLALDEVQRGLEEENYEVRTFLIPASSVGAPHQRERIFVLGIRKDVFDIEGEYRQRNVSMAISDQFMRCEGLPYTGKDGKSRQESDDGDVRHCGESCGTQISINPLWPTVCATEARQGYQNRNNGKKGTQKSLSTVVIETGVWRTPDANMTRGAISEEKYVERVQRGMPNALNYQVAHEERKWITPCSRDWKGSVSESKYQERLKKGNGLDHQIAHEERKWSTPQACDGRQGAVIGKEDTFKRLPSGRLRKINKNGVDGSIGLAREVVLDIRQATQVGAVKGQLNPQWVEQLMGYPDGWTDPDCDDPTPWMGWPARPGEPQYPYEHSRTVVGMKNRAKRLKALGNAVVPQQAEPIFRTIAFIDYMTGGQ